MNLVNFAMDRRRSKDYRQLSGHIPVAMYKKFKATCAERDVNQSEALEQALARWIEEDSQQDKAS